METKKKFTGGEIKWLNMEKQNWALLEKEMATHSTIPAWEIP